jgi:hypothetical protein
MVEYEKALVDFGIIVALPEEFTALENAFEGFSKPDYSEARAFYHKSVQAEDDQSRSHRVVSERHGPSRSRQCDPRPA